MLAVSERNMCRYFFLVIIPLTMQLNNDAHSIYIVLSTGRVEMIYSAQEDVSRENADTRPFFGRHLPSVDFGILWGPAIHLLWILWADCI